MIDLKITAAVPCYNAEKFIDTCIKSLLNQTVKPIEIIVVNDGSKDSSEQKIKKYEGIRLFNHDCNLGLAAARNTAIKSAIGDVIVFIDADARAYPDFIEKLIECYSNESFAGVGGEAIEGNLITIYDRWRSFHAYQGQKEKVLKNVDMIAGVASSYRKEVFDKCGLFDTYFRTNGEDMELGLRLKNKGFKLLYNPHAKVDHLRSDNFKSLSKMIFNWYYYGFTARKRVYGNASSWYFYVISKHLLRNVFQDLFINKSISLAFISVIMALVEYSSVVKNIFPSK
jgi:GT2 family glycosyltransferase